MEVKRARTLIEVAGQIVQVNPRTGDNCLCCVTNADTKFDDGFIRCDVLQSELVAARNVFGSGDFTARRANDFNHTSRRVVNQCRDVVLRLNLEGTGHGCFVAQTSQSAVSRVSKPAGLTMSSALPIWNSAIQRVWKPALQA